jgi:superfamily II DNA or RNA helicase
MPVPKDWLDTLPRAADCLRDYQRGQIADVATEMHAGHTRILAQAPTGAGKTHIIATVTMAAAAAELRVLVLATRTRLVRQIHERLDAFDIPHGVIAAPLPHLRNYSARIQVASVDTLNRRALVSERIPLPSADVVLFDEAHLATAETRLRLLESYPAAVRIGFTATPARKSGRSLGAAFDCMVLGPTIKALTAAGVLVPTRIFNTPLVSTKELRSVPKDTDSDFKAGPLGEMLSRPKLVGDVVANWLRIANRKRTLCFAVNKAHGAALLDSFRQQGVAAEMLTDADEEDTREEIIGRLESGQTSVVINCFLLAYGVDVPSVECIILARPTRSLTMYLQMVGRGLRAAPGKIHCIVIDHGHVVEHLGLPQSDFAWSLDPDANVNAAATQASERKSATEALRTCRECSEIWLTSEQGHACPSCGWAPVPRSKPVAFEEAELEELADDETRPTPNDARVTWFYREACGWYSRRWPDRWRDTPNKGRAWAWMQTQAKFLIAAEVRIPSAYWSLPLALPSAEVSGWLQHRIIKWAKAQQKARAA